MRPLSTQEILFVQGGANIFSDTVSAVQDGLTNSEIGMMLFGGAGGLVIGFGLGNQIIVAAVGLAAIGVVGYVGYEWYFDKDKITQAV